MLFFFGRFGNGRLLKYCRDYSKRTKRSVSWETVFDQKTSRAEALRVFKEKLSECIDTRNLSCIQHNPYAKESLHFLVQKSSISEINFEKSVISLYKLILQRRISDDRIYEAISHVSSNFVVNLAMPSAHVLKDAKHLIEKPSLHIHPEQKDHLEGVIKEIGGHNKAVLEDKLFQETEHKPPSSHSNIDVEHLQEYLHKAEQGKDHRKRAWEERRPYNWDRNLNDLPRVNAGSLFFAYKSKPSRRSSLLTTIKRSMENMKHHSLIQSSPKDLLIYNFERHSKIIIPASHTNSIFNINYRDLFGVINGSGNAPDETLVIINQLETEGWKLIGDLYDNSENVVFQRTADFGHKAKPMEFLRIWVVPSTAILTGLGICYFTMFKK